MLPLPTPIELSNVLRGILPRFAHIDWVSQTGSTNTDLIVRARLGEGQILKPWLLGAHHQTAGQGRGGKVWDNLPGTQLMFSCAFDVFIPSRQLPTLSPLMGLAACLALRGLLPDTQDHQLSLKWPNDIMWGHAKLAGILTEVTRGGASLLSADHHIVVVGIGINLSEGEALSHKLDRPVADWQQLCHTYPEVAYHSPAHVVASIAHQWWQQLNEVTTHGFQDLIEQYRQVDYLYQQPVHIVHEGLIRDSGIAVGINNQGQLLVQSGAQTQAVSVGEISIRPHTKGTDTGN